MFATTVLSAQSKRNSRGWNVGLMGEGGIRSMDAAILEIVGEWVRFYDEALRSPRPVDIEIEGKKDDRVAKIICE